MNIVITQSLSGITPANRNRCGPNLVCQRVTTFRKFWRDCPTRVKLGSTELGRVPRSRFFFVTNTRRFFGNSRYVSNLSTTRESMSHQNVSEGIFEKFPFRGHLPPKTTELKAVKQVPYSEQTTAQGTHC